jgi:hypothetical protein
VLRQVILVPHVGRSRFFVEVVLFFPFVNYCCYSQGLAPGTSFVEAAVILCRRDEERKKLKVHTVNFCVCFYFASSCRPAF